jgi:hypothetical protein
MSGKGSKMRKHTIVTNNDNSMIASGAVVIEKKGKKHKREALSQGGSFESLIGADMQSVMKGNESVRSDMDRYGRGGTRLKRILDGKNVKGILLEK